MLYLFIYLADIVEALRNTLIAAPIVLALVGAMCLCGFMSTTVGDKDEEEAIKKVFKFFKKFYITLIIMLFVGLLVPSKSALYQIAGVYCGKQINQQIHIDKKLQKVSEIIDLQLDKNIKELSQNK